MAEGIAFSIAGKLAEYTVDPVLRQIKYLFFYNSNIQNLRDKVQDLENKRNDVKLRVDAAERNAEMIGNEVSAWLRKVDDLKKKADDVLNCVAGSEMLCLFNRCPNLKSRYLLSRRATKMTIEGDKLEGKGTFERVGYSPPPVPRRVFDPTPHEELETRLSIKKKIKEALKDKEIGIIGICGMPGVGKTTMADEIEKEVESEKLFSEVAYAVVSNNPDVNKIQDALAERLGLKIEERTVARAKLLHQRLECKDGKSILVILDDVWKGIALGTIGIPSPSDHKGLKIMFTTRIEDNKMGAQRTFKIPDLGEREGWELFKKMAGISDDETDVGFVSIAQEVARECGGLPLALEVVGGALKNNKALHKWRDALQQLKKARVTNLEGMHELVYSRIELSYNYLKSNEDRDLLLLCSLFAEDESIPIENLVRYARGLELFPNTGTLYETRDRAYSIADNLKSCCLLQSGDKEDEVKLHDVIRDFCLQICGYLVNHAGLKEWPELDADESYISITFDKLDQLPGGLKYQNVKLLRVICRYMGERNNSEEFFQYMKELRVLELKKMPFPSSIQLLTGLRTLCLISCELDPQLSMIGSLKKLEILCLYDSYFGDSVPKELANFRILNLSNLKSLDLRFRDSYPLVPGVLSGMKKLEELYLGDYIPMEGEDQRYIIIEELRSLNSLRAFQISTFDNQILKQILGALSLENLENFQITGGLYLYGIIEEDSTEDNRFKRGLYLYGNDTTENLQPEINSLMKRTYHLEIENARVLKNVVSELDGDGFINLKTLEISFCNDFEYLIDATNSIPSGTLGKLKSLILEHLPKLTEICNGNLPSPRGVFKPPLFCNLMDVRMSECDAIRSMFRESVAKCLVNLQSLLILRCPMLEEVVSTEGEEVTKTCKMLEFPKLKTVALRDLKSLKSFTSQSNGEVFCQTLFNQVTFPNMEELVVSGLDCIAKLFDKEMSIASLHKLEDIHVLSCVKLLAIAESDSIHLLQNLHYLNVEECDALEVLFDFEGIKVTNDAEINMLGQLKLLEMGSLPKLVHITRMVPKGIRVFEKLTTLLVVRCGSLKYLFSPSMANSLVALEFLKISDCKLIEEIVGEEEEGGDTSETKIVEGMKIRIVFPNLNRLLLTYLPRIQMLCSQNHELAFPPVKDLTIRNCPMMKKSERGRQLGRGGTSL